MTDESTGNIIVEMMDEHRRLMEHVRTTGDISLQSRVEAHFAKTLWLSAASFFEYRITTDVEQIFMEATNGSHALVAFVHDKAIARGYSSWFNWDDSRPNANKLFRSFGPDFSETMKDKIRNDKTEKLQKSISDFIELGRIRNDLVHRDFVTYNLDKTVDEVFALYESAIVFVNTFPVSLRQFISDQRVSTGS